METVLRGTGFAAGSGALSSASIRTVTIRAAALLGFGLFAAPLAAQSHVHGREGDRRVTVFGAAPVATRPYPPRIGRNRCIAMDGIAAAQLFSDRAIELVMRDGRRYRMFFARECPGLSFYQGFYYRRARAGRLCAGRDAVGARSGGECAIASIIEIRRLPPAQRSRGRAQRK